MPLYDAEPIGLDFCTSLMRGHFRHIACEQLIECAVLGDNIPGVYQMLGLGCPSPSVR